MNRPAAFTPLAYDFPPGNRVKWIGSLLKGRLIQYQIVGGAAPRVVVYPKTAEQVLEVEALVKMVLTYEAVGPIKSRLPQGRARVLFILALVLAFILMVLLTLAIRLLISRIFA